jgi:hypothetical protein
VICDARAEQCRCHKDAGHVEAGDRVHACDPRRCTGEWIGDHDGGDFAVVAWPFPVGDPEPWPFA